MAKFEAPGIKELDHDGFFKKNKKICIWKKLLEGKALLSSNYFHRCTLNFPKIESDVQTYS